MRTTSPPKPAELKADFALVSDTELFAPGLPTLCVGLRGMIYTELEVRGAKTDLHSGMYGGAAPNPFFALAQIIAKLKDENGHILIPGFYDDIIPPSPEELAAWRSLPFDEEEYRKTEVGSKQLVGEAGYSVLERTWARPTLDVHGMPGGFIGAGAKTVIPAKAAGQGLHAPGSRHDAGQGLCALQELRGEDRARRRRRRCAADSLRRPLPDSRRQSATSRPPRARCTRSGARTRSSSAPAAPSPSSATLTVTWACPA